MAHVKHCVQEAREKLEQLDLATSKAQGWLRGKDAHQRLAAMEMLISAYPPQPDAPPTVPAASAPATPTSASAEEHRTQAGNPFAMFAKGVWQQRPHRQEEERLAVQAHLQSSTAAASIAAQASGPKPLPVPEVNFFDAWKATDAFSAECALHHSSVPVSKVAPVCTAESCAPCHVCRTSRYKIRFMQSCAGACC